MKMSRKSSLAAMVALFLGSAVAVSAQEVPNWKGTMGAGGYVEFSHFAFANTNLDLITQGLSFTYGVNRKLRVGANAGFFVTHRDGDTGGTVTGFSIAPTIQYDLIQKPGGSFYVVSHPLGYDLLSFSGGNSSVWNLDFLTAGVGIEGLISRSVGVWFEGDALRMGITRAADHTEFSIGAIAFPAVRGGLRMYF